VGNRYSNNLFLLEAGEHWKGKTNEHKGRKYRAYKDWESASIDYTDYIVFSRLYDLPLLCRKDRDQLQALSISKPNYREWFQDTSHLIDLLNLTEFDE
jgi:hypothetical protein